MRKKQTETGQNTPELAQPEAGNCDQTEEQSRNHRSCNTYSSSKLTVQNNKTVCIIYTDKVLRP